MADRPYMVRYLKEYGYKNLWVGKGVKLPISQCKDSRIYYAYMNLRQRRARAVKELPRDQMEFAF